MDSNSSKRIQNSTVDNGMRQIGTDRMAIRNEGWGHTESLDYAALNVVDPCSATGDKTGRGEKIYIDD